MAQIILQEESSTPSSPGTGRWKLYPTASGWYAIDDTGSITGPFGTGNITIEEQDGSPSISNVDKIVFSGASVSDLGGGDVLVSSLGDAPSDGTQYARKNAAWEAVAASGGGELENLLINGGFDFAQRQAPGTLTTYAANTYSVDRWKTYAENASYQYQRQDGLGETGLTSRYFGAFKKITSTGKMFHYQILEGVNSVALRSKTVIFQCQMKASSAKTIRMGVFELQTAGTIDSVPSPIVTAAGANTVDPTMGANVAIITAAQSKSVTTAMQTFSVSVTVPATSKNLICAVWTDSQFAANDILYIAEAGLYVASSAQDWKPRLIATELQMCQRYYESSYALDVAPNTADGYNETARQGIAWGPNNIGVKVPWASVKRIAPTMAFYALDGAAGAGTAARVRDDTAGGLVAITASTVTTQALGLVTSAGGFTAARQYGFQFTADAEL